MQTPSAAEAIGQAFTYTRGLLGSPRPFRLGRFFKLALLAAVTQSSFVSVSVNYPLQGARAFAAHTRNAADQFIAGSGSTGMPGAAGLGLIAVFGLVAILFVLFVLFLLGYTYLLCRARATLFDLVIFRGGRVRACWRRVRRAALRYFGLYLLVMLLTLVLLAAVLGPVIVHGVQVAAHGGHGTGALPFPPSLVVTVLALFLLLVPVLIAVDVLLQDFILPALVLDGDAPLAAAFRRLGEVVQSAPGQVLLFVILRTIVAFAIGLALGIVTLVGVGVAALGAYGAGKLLYSALWTGGVAAHAAFFAAVAGLGLVVALLYLVCITMVYGVTGTFKASYAAIFFAGYYPELAAALGGSQVAPSVVSSPSAILPQQIW